MKCKKHSTYRGIHKPTATCRKCRLIFSLRRVLKACGFRVAEIRRGKDFLFVDKPKPPYSTFYGIGKAENVGALFSPEQLAAVKTKPFRTDCLSITISQPPARDQQDALTLQVAAIKAGAESRETVFRGEGPQVKVVTPE